MLFAIVVGGCLIILTLLVVFIFFIRKFCKKKQTSHVSLRFPLPAPTGESDIMDDTQYDTHVKAPRTSSTEGSVDLEAEPKEVPAPFVPTIIRENKEDVASAPVAPPKIESRYLFEAPPPYEEDPTQTQSGGQRRMVAIKLSECCIPRSSTTTPSTQTGKHQQHPAHWMQRLLDNHQWSIPVHILPGNLLMLLLLLSQKVVKVVQVSPLEANPHYLSLFKPPKKAKNPVKLRLMLTTTAFQRVRQAMLRKRDQLPAVLSLSMVRRRKRDQF